MNRNLSRASDFTSGYQFCAEGSIFVSDPNPYAAYWDVFHQHGNLLDVDPLGFAANTSIEEDFVPSMSINSVTDPSLEDTDFSETTKFISQILMDENLEQGPFYDSLSLQLTEKSFHDALIDNNNHNNNNKASLSPNQHPLNIQGLEGETTSNDSDSSSNNYLHNNYNVGKLNPPPLDTPIVVIGDYAFQLNSHGLLELDSSATKPQELNNFSDADSVSHFTRGLEEASKFLLPQGPQTVTGLESSRGESSNIVEENSLGVKGSRKNRERGESDSQEEGRSNKQSAVGVIDEDDLSDMLDRVLLNMEQFPLGSEHNSQLSRAAKAKQQGEKSSDGAKAHPKKLGRKKETVDMRTLLLLCAQAIHDNDKKGADELLKQIRQHSSPYGDASQRLAHYFANGLEARLVGDVAAAQLFSSAPTHKMTSAADFLEGYHVYLSPNPNRKCAHFYVNKMIKKASAKAETLHIIDFGILYGFQWPLLIKFLSERAGGPPKLRITGIEFPLPGFRPTQRIEETGRRLASYCKRFNVPFEYNAIASRNWETIRVEDLKIRSNEFVAVNCMMRLKNVLNETTEMNSPRDSVLLLIRRINPVIFCQSIINASFSTPFFITRFREALFHFSAVFDMLDTIISRENQWRVVNEREIVGRSCMNVIACEGLERVERPETYKQWQVRNTRAGFKQLPLNKKLMAKFSTKLRKWYPGDFIIDEDNNWLLQSWKGRILSCSTIWVPA